MPISLIFFDAFAREIKFYYAPFYSPFFLLAIVLIFVILDPLDNNNVHGDNDEKEKGRSIKS